jgi:hypothetical protein
MSELFEENIKPLISHYKNSKKRKNGNRQAVNKQNSRRTTRNNGSGPSTSHSNQNSNHSNNDDDDDDNDDNENGRSRLSKTNGRNRRAQQSNGVSSSRDSQPGSSRLRVRNNRLPSSHDEESETTESSSEESSNASEESSGIPLAELGKPFTRKSHKRNKKQTKQSTVSSSSQKKRPRNTIRQKVNDNEEERVIPEEDQESEGSDHDSNDISDDNQHKTSRRTASRRTSKRMQTTSDDENKNNMGTDDSKRRRVTRKPKRYESDQSFHVEGSGRKRVVDSDDSDHPRATRESTRKKFQEWAVTSDDDYDQKPQTSSQANRSVIRKSTRNKKVIRSDSEQSDEKKSKALPSRRSTRTQASHSQEDESNESDQQNQPSTSTITNVRQSSRLTVSNGQSTVIQRTTRSSQIASTSRNDHNYGEPSSLNSATTSQSSTTRNTRSTILSRHQRNADELDRSGLEDTSLNTSSNTRLLRLRSANLRAAPTPSSNFEALNGIRRTMRPRTTHNYFEEENEEDEGPVVQQVQQSQTRLSNRITRQQDRHSQPSDSDSYSEEDKTPLKLMASSSQRAHEHNTRNGAAAVNRIKRNLYSDDTNSDQVQYLL